MTVSYTHLDVYKRQLYNSKYTTLHLSQDTHVVTGLYSRVEYTKFTSEYTKLNLYSLIQLSKFNNENSNYTGWRKSYLTLFKKPTEFIYTSKMAVSYTHLDVYKRQAILTRFRQGYTVILPIFFELYKI